MPESVPKAKKDDNKSGVYKKEWIDSCHQQTLLPGAPWHGIEDELSQELAVRASKQFSNPQRKAAILSLIGPEFVRRHFPDVDNNTSLLDSLDGSQRTKLLQEARSWLHNQLNKVVGDLGYQQLLTVPTQEVKSHEKIATFFQHIYTSFYNGLDRRLYQFEQQLIKEKEEASRSSVDRKRKQPRTTIPTPTITRSSTATTVASLKPNSHVKEEDIYRAVGDPPPLWGPQSDEMGRAVVTLLEAHPTHLGHVVARLQGRQLPGSLRAFVWAEVLMREDGKANKGGSVERVVRERFGRTVQRGLGTLRVKHATYSPIHGLIQNAVSESYSHTTCLVPYKEESHMKEASRSLNILYVYDQTYEPYLVHWLFPLQIAFQANENEAGEHAYELAMYLDLLRTHCFPKWPQIYAIAEKIMTSLQSYEQKLYDHLKTIARRNFHVNPKEFLEQLIRQEMGQKEESGHDASTRLSQISPRETASILADPLIFVRKWIGEGFVGLLDSPAVMYVWDQCFMQSWDVTTVEHICLAVLLLLSHKFMEATDYNSMKQVFLHEGCKLYTHDIQMAYVHLQHGMAPEEVPYMNRQRPISPLAAEIPVPESVVSTKSVAQPLHMCAIKDVNMKLIFPATSIKNISPPAAEIPLPESVVSTKSVAHPLHMCAIKDVNMKLIFHATSTKKAPWIKQLDGSSLTVDVTLHFGSIKLQTHPSAHPAEIIRTENDVSGGSVVYARLPRDVFVFEDVDITQYDVERELGGSPYVTLSVAYIVTDKNGEISRNQLGWARATVFTQDGSNTWVAVPSQHTFPLHPGDVPIDMISPQRVTPVGDSLLGYNSELSLTVYNPTQPTPTPKLPSPKPKPEPKAALPLPTPTPKPKTPPTKDPPKSEASWVPHNTHSIKPPEINNTRPFDLYVDAVRYIPDCATIIKVTGRYFRVGTVLPQPPDITAFPSLSSDARCPAFSLRECLNPSGVPVDVMMVVMLRVYTVDVGTEKVAVVGSCLLPVYNTQDNKITLNSGGHQLRLYHGLPPLIGQPEHLTHTFFDQSTPIPAASILVRLLPHSQEPVKAPPYKSGYYNSATCEPSTSETRIFTSYKQHMAYPSNVREMIQRLMTSDGLEPHEENRDLEEWAVKRLDSRPLTDSSQNSQPEQKPGNVDLVQCVRYRLRTGLCAQIRQAFGIKDVQYVQCFTRVVPGSTALGMATSEEGYGSLEKWVTLKLDYDGLMSAPVWLDQPKEAHPFYDEYSCLVIQMFGLKVQYRPLPDHSAPGTVSGLKGVPLDLGDRSVVGWGVVPLFQGNSVLCGDHHVPLFRGKPSKEILEALNKNTINSVLRTWKWAKQEVLSPASLHVTLWDGHFDFDHIPLMPIYENQLQAVGDLTKYQRQRTVTVGNHLSAIILSSLTKKEQKGGTGSDVYAKECSYFDDVMTRTFYELIESALMTAGFGPL